MSTRTLNFKKRWYNGLFFRWKKQNLQNQTFLGTGENTVMVQIWGAPMHFLPVAYIRFLAKVTIILTAVTACFREQVMSNSHR